MDYRALTDTELAIHLRNGDAEAFQEIYFRHWKKLLVIAGNKLPLTDNPEDLIQDLFVNLWEQRHKITVSNPGAYLYTSLRNAIINRYRSRLLHEKYAVQTAEALLYEQNTEDEIALNDLITSVERQLDDLPEKTHRIFRLNRLEYKSVKEISSLMNMPERTVEHHITVAVRKLRLLLKDYLILAALFLAS